MLSFIHSLIEMVIACGLQSAGGRLDLPDSDKNAMFDSLQALKASACRWHADALDESIEHAPHACIPRASHVHPLSCDSMRIMCILSCVWNVHGMCMACTQALDESITVYPGHGYNGESSTVGREKREGLLRAFSREQWLSMHG